MRRGLRARATNGPIPPRSSLDTSARSTRHTSSTSCHADWNAARFGSFSGSLSSLHSFGPLTMFLLPGDHLAPSPLPPASLPEAGGGGAAGERAACHLFSYSPRRIDGRVSLLGSTSSQCPPAAWHSLSPSWRRLSGWQSRSGSVGPLLFGAPDWALHVTAWASPSCSCVRAGGGGPRSLLHLRGGGCPLGAWPGGGGSCSGLCWLGLFSSLLPALSPVLSGIFFCSSSPLPNPTLKSNKQ